MMMLDLTSDDLFELWCITGTGETLEEFAERKESEYARGHRVVIGRVFPAGVPVLIGPDEVTYIRCRFGS